MGNVNKLKFQKKGYRMVYCRAFGRKIKIDESRFEVRVSTWNGDCVNMSIHTHHFSRDYLDEIMIEEL